MPSREPLPLSRPASYSSCGQKFESRSECVGDELWTLIRCWRGDNGVARERVQQPARMCSDLLLVSTFPRSSLIVAVTEGGLDGRTRPTSVGELPGQDGEWHTNKVSGLGEASHISVRKSPPLSAIVLSAVRICRHCARIHCRNETWFVRVACGLGNLRRSTVYRVGSVCS